MFNRSLWRFIAVWLVTLGVMACTTIMRPTEMFPEGNRDFVKRVRWLDYQGAAQHMVEVDRQGFLDRFAEDEDLRVVDFEIERIDFRDDGLQVEVRYILEYYRLPSVTVKKERFKLEWEFREEKKMMPGTWLITTEFPQLP